MTSLLPELEAVPPGLQLDAELVAFDRRGQPDFYRLSRRMLHGDGSIPVALMVFDVLAVDGEPLTQQPYAERRERLANLPLEEPARVVPSFEDGVALWREVLARGLEGVVAKRTREPYRPGERAWLKRKNPDGPRFDEAKTAAIRYAERRRHLTVRIAAQRRG